MARSSLDSMQHEQQGSNVWYCPEVFGAIRVDNPSKSELTCPHCGELTQPFIIR